MDPAGLPALIDAIRHMHGCEATWVESVPVRETFKGEVRPSSGPRSRVEGNGLEPHLATCYVPVANPGNISGN